MNHGAGELRGEPEPATEAPAVIHLPDLSQPPAAKRKGRHFGPRRVPDPRTARFDVRCTPAFRTKVLADAAAAGLSLSAFVCAQLGGGPGPRAHRNPGPEAVLLAKVLAEMGKSGSNLNQIARLGNVGEEIDGAELATVLADLATVREAILKALGRDA